VAGWGRIGGRIRGNRIHDATVLSVLPSVLPDSTQNRTRRGIDGMEEKPIITLVRLKHLDRQGLITLTCDSKMVSEKQAPGRGIRAYVQALTRKGGEQGICGSHKLLINGYHGPRSFLEGFVL